MSNSPQSAQALATPETASATVENLNAHGMSFVDLFLQAGWFVQGVMILLVLASVIGILLFFLKTFQFMRLRGAGRSFEKEFFNASDFGALYEKVRDKRLRSPLHHVFCAGLEEYWSSKEASQDNVLAAGVLPRVRRKMDLTLTRELESAESGLSFLATVGSTAPFIGLLGTVWGIMGSFQGIAAAKNTSLAIVAPGIAEALLATAFGLFAAIPAVIAYNKLSTELGQLASRVETFCAELLNILERQEEAASAVKK